ncbi:MAG: alcohol dehydrogenase catalytic domain-containing protein, partial [Pseudomonadota bacterium]
MKALFYTGPEALEFRDASEPQPRQGEVSIKIESVGICGSDIHAYLGHDDRRPAPLILGHEAAGVIFGGPRDGDRVTINPLVTDPNSAESRAGRENLCPGRQIISMPPRGEAERGWVSDPKRDELRALSVNRDGLQAIADDSGGRLVHV